MQTTLNKKFANFKYWHEIEKKLNSFTGDLSKAKRYLKKMGLSDNYHGDKRQKSIFIGIDDTNTETYIPAPWIYFPIATYRNIDSHWFLTMSPPHGNSGYYKDINSIAIHKRRQRVRAEEKLLESERRSDCTGSIERFICSSIQFGHCQWYRYGYMSSKDDFTRKDLIQCFKQQINRNIRAKQEDVVRLKEFEAELKPESLTIKKLTKAQNIIKAGFHKMEQDIRKIFKDFKWCPHTTDPDRVIHNMTASGPFKSKLEGDSGRRYLISAIESRKSEIKRCQRQNAYLIDVIKHLYSLKEEHPKSCEFLVWCVEHGYEKNIYSKEQKEEYLCQIKKDLKTKKTAKKLK